MVYLFIYIFYLCYTKLAYRRDVVGPRAKIIMLTHLIVLYAVLK